MYGVGARRPHDVPTLVSGGTVAKIGEDDASAFSSRPNVMLTQPLLVIFKRPGGVATARPMWSLTPIPAPA